MTLIRITAVETIVYTRDFPEPELRAAAGLPDDAPITEVIDTLHDTGEISEDLERHGDVQGNEWTWRQVPSPTASGDPLATHTR